MIELKGVRKSFGSLEVLKGIDAEVSKGEVVCVIGPSGSGKSTILRCINGLERYNAGRITVDGELVDCDAASIVSIRTQVAMVFQRFNLFPHRTALENVVEGPIYVKGEPRAQALERGRELLASVGLADKATPIRCNCPAASSSAWRSRGRWPCNPRRSCSTNRPRRSTLNWWATCWG